MTAPSPAPGGLARPPVPVLLSTLGCLALGAAALGACGRGGEGKPTPATTAADVPTDDDAQVSPDGRTVTMTPAMAARFAVTEAAAAPVAAKLAVPARTVATAVGARDLPAPLVLFETPELSSLYGEVVRARAGFDRAAKQRARLRELLRHDAAAGKDVDDAEADYAESEATLREAEGKLREAGLDPDFLGRLRPGTAFVVADLVEANEGLAKVGMSATAQFTALPGRVLPARVVSVAQAVDPQTRTVRVGLTVDDTQDPIRPGMFASVTLDGAAVPTVTVPSTAAVAADAKRWMFVRVAPTRFERREVVLGTDDGTRVEVRGGIRPGEQVVTGNAILLKGIAFGY